MCASGLINSCVRPVTRSRGRRGRKKVTHSQRSVKEETPREAEMKKVHFTICAVHLFVLSVSVLIASARASEEAPRQEETAVGGAANASVVTLISMNQLSTGDRNRDECASCSGEASTPATVAASTFSDSIVKSINSGLDDGKEEASKTEKGSTREERMRKEGERKREEARKDETTSHQSSSSSSSSPSVVSLESSNSTEYHKFAVVTNTIDLTSDSMSMASSDELTHAESTSKSSEEEETETKRDASQAKAQRTNTTDGLVTRTLVNNVTERASSSSSPRPVSRDTTTGTVASASGHSDDASEKDETKFSEEPVDSNSSSDVREHNGQYQLYNSKWTHS